MNHKVKSVIDTKKTFPKNTRFVFEDFLIACPYSVECLRQRTRVRDIMQWRQLGMVWMALETVNLTNSGKFFDKDHSTVVHALKIVRDANKGYDWILKEKIDKIMNHIELSVPYSNDMNENEKNSLIYLERLIKEKLKEHESVA